MPKSLKAQDHAGNTHLYGSDGVVFDTAAPVISGAEDGKTYCSAVEITVTDTNLEEVKVDGSAVTVNDNKFTVVPKDGEQEIAATDKAGNTKTIKITVNNGHDWNEPAYNWAEDGSSCAAERICKRDGSHKETANAATVTRDVTKEPSCTEKGEAVYTAVFTEEWAKSEPAQTKTGEIPAAGHRYAGGECTVCGGTDKSFSPSIKAGAKGIWHRGDKDGLSITSDAAFNHFIKVQIDGKDLDEADYEVREGSTIVTLKNSYLESLSSGGHEISIVSETGTAKATFTIEDNSGGNSGDSSVDNSSGNGADSGGTAGREQKKGNTGSGGEAASVQSGDESDPVLWTGLMLAALAAAGAVFFDRRKKSKIF